MKCLVLVLAFAVLSQAKLSPWDLTLPQFGRIVGGEEAAVNSIPYQVGLILSVGTKQAFCGGSLVSNQYVVTAAHCTAQASDATVILGAHKIRDEGESTQIRFHVSKENLITHPNWNQLRLINDIALIKLPEPVQFSDIVSTVKLPEPNSGTYEGREARISGWGIAKDGESTISEVLRYAHTDVITNKDCSSRLFGIIKDTHVCTSGKQGKSTCSGDSGGPLTVLEGDDHVLVGLTSFGISFGCEKGFPAAFTRITSYVDWINQHIN